MRPESDCGELCGDPWSHLISLGSNSRLFQNGREPFAHNDYTRIRRYGVIPVKTCLQRLCAAMTASVADRGYGQSRNCLRPRRTRKAPHKCNRYGHPSSIRKIDHAVNRLWDCHQGSIMRCLLPAIYFADAVFADFEPAPKPAPGIAAAT